MEVGPPPGFPIDVRGAPRPGPHSWPLAATKGMGRGVDPLLGGRRNGDRRRGHEDAPPWNRRFRIQLRVARIEGAGPCRADRHAEDTYPRTQYVLHMRKELVQIGRSRTAAEEEAVEAGAGGRSDGAKGLSQGGGRRCGCPRSVRVWTPDPRVLVRARDATTGRWGSDAASLHPPRAGGDDPDRGRQDALRARVRERRWDVRHPRTRPFGERGRLHHRDARERDTPGPHRRLRRDRARTDGSAGRERHVHLRRAARRNVRVP